MQTRVIRAQDAGVDLVAVDRLLGDLVHTSPSDVASVTIAQSPHTPAIAHALQPGWAKRQ